MKSILKEQAAYNTLKRGQGTEMKRFLEALLLLDCLLLCLFLAPKSEKNALFPVGEEDFPVSADALEMMGNNTEEKKIALTFDDGPHPSYTEELLDGLKERNVQVTFFVTGEHAALHKDLIARMQKEGHLIGNHTYSHIQLQRDNLAAFREELVHTNEVLSEIIGEEVLYVRPPYGIWDKSLETELNMIPVLWTIDPLDWCSKNEECVVKRVVTKARENGIILMHDYYDTSVKAALSVVDELTSRGYTFVTVDKVLFD